MRSVLIRSRFSLAIASLVFRLARTSVRAVSSFFLEFVSRSLVVARCWRGRHADHGLFRVAALPYPLPAFRAQLQEARRLVVQALSFMAVPERFAHNAPHHFWPEIIFVVEAVHARHHLG